MPFLDHELVEFAATIPAKYKINGRRIKHVLKEAVKDLLRPDTLSKGKHGFAVPYPVWFRDPLREYVADTLLGPTARSRGLFNAQVVEEMIEKQRTGQETHYRQLWWLMALSCGPVGSWTVLQSRSRARGRAYFLVRWRNDQGF